MATTKTIQLVAGDVVYTTVADGEDFGLPLVRPIRARRGRVVRTVRNVVKCRGGSVVWFDDSTKTPPLHGGTVWESPGVGAQAGPPAVETAAGGGDDAYAFLAR